MRLDLARLVAGLTGTALLVEGCGVSTSTVDLARGPVPVRLATTPAIASSGAPVEVRVTSPNADSIELRSANGLDRYAGAGSALRVSLAGNFGDIEPEAQFAVRAQGRLLNVLKKPVNILVCHNQRCESYYHELPVRLPERNRRRVAITASWSNAFSRRAVKNGDGPLDQRTRGRSEWNLQAEWAGGTVNGRLQGFDGPDGRGGTVDLSRELKHGEGGLNYGLAIHLGVVDAQWARTAGIAAGNGTPAYRASIGPAIMLQGVTASSQLGIYTDGSGTLQELSTFISINGALTEVRIPLTVIIDRTSAFGDEPFGSRRREQLERLTVAWEVVPSLALRMRIASHRSTWPVGQAGYSLQADQADYSLGAQYSVGW